MADEQTQEQTQEHPAGAAKHKMVSVIIEDPKQPKKGAPFKVGCNGLFYEIPYNKACEVPDIVAAVMEQKNPPGLKVG